MKKVKDKQKKDKWGQENANANACSAAEASAAVAAFRDKCALAAAGPGHDRRLAVTGGLLEGLPEEHRGDHADDGEGHLS